MSNESHRVYYVALSRARKKLYINVSLLSENKHKFIEDLGIEIIQLKKTF